MEKYIILAGSVIIPTAILIALVLFRRQVRRNREIERAKFDHERQQAREVIGTLERLVEVKDDLIKRIL